MTADAAIEIASYVQIGNEFGQLQNVSWLTVTYVIAVTVAQPVVSKTKVVTVRSEHLSADEINYHNIV